MSMMSKSNIIVLLLLATAPLAVQCTGERKAAVEPAVEAVQFDKEQVWQLVAMRGKELPRNEAEVLLMFHPESGTLRGRIACNRYFADYVLHLDNVSADGSRYHLKVADVNGGDVQCPEGGMAAQERYLALLAKTTDCLLTPYTLTLFQKDKEILKFELQ